MNVRLLVLVAALALGCPTPAPLCDTQKCGGCCVADATGESVCDPGTTQASCGQGTCRTCGSSEACVNQQCVARAAGGSAGGGSAGGGSTAGGSTAGGSTAGGSALLVTGLSVAYSAGRDTVEVRWTNPSDPSLTRVRLLRALDVAPTGAMDPAATLVFEGLATIATHAVSELEPDVPYRSYLAGAKAPLAQRLPLRQPRVYHYAVFACSATTCETTGARTTFRRNLTEALLKGGYTLFWRHASALTCQDDFGLGNAPAPLLPDWWKACRSTTMPLVCGARVPSADGGVTVTTNGPFARQLTDPAAAGEIANIRTWLEQKQIPFGLLRSSEFCRCSETARGYFAHLSATLPVQETPELTLSVYGARCPNVLAATATPPAAGTNTGIVSHSGMGCPTDLLAWSQVAIFRPVATATACSAAMPCTQPDEACVQSLCWRRELVGTLFDDEWAEIPPL